MASCPDPRACAGASRARPWPRYAPRTSCSNPMADRNTDLQRRSDVVVIRTPASERSRQEVPVVFGVSRTSAGAEGVALNVTTFPPGGCSIAHKHCAFETALYG